MSDVAIADHAFLSDARTCALVTREGSVDWLCLPRFDSAPVLARLLDDDAGHLRLRPADPQATSTWRYLPRSLVLETTWTCRDGDLVVHDALALGRHEAGHDIGRSSPGVLLRSAQCTAGEVGVCLDWSPRPEFGLVHPRMQQVSGGLVTHGGSTVLRLSTDAAISISQGGAHARVTIAAGKHLCLALEQGDAFGAPLPRWSTRAIRRRIAATQQSWESWSSLHQRYQGPLAEQVHLSGLVMQGLTHARTGAIVAAGTTSLPEGVGTGRTWDYRYTWVRDASMTLRGLWVAACPDEGRRFFDFLARAAGTQLARGLPLQIMFGIGGERDLSEREVGHLSGWRDSGPVRVGNDAWQQRQQDVYGALLDAAWVLREHLGNLDPATNDLLVAAVETAARTWREPDSGIWEIRGEPQRYLHSALMSWVALDRGVKLADLLGAADDRERWIVTRDEIATAIADEGWNPTVGAFTQTFAGTEIDASALLIGTVGLLAPDDPRVTATIDVVQRVLGDSRGLVRRYTNDDGLAGEEGSFLLCTFWLAEALALAGRLGEAEEVLRSAAGFANDLGLLAEQVDSATGELLGNFPQAFSHLGLVLAAQALATAQGES